MSSPFVDAEDDTTNLCQKGGAADEPSLNPYPPFQWPSQDFLVATKKNAIHAVRISSGPGEVLGPLHSHCDPGPRRPASNERF